MSAGAVAGLVLIVFGAILAGLWSMIDWEVDLGSRPAPEDEGETQPLYRGVRRRYDAIPPSRIEWLGGDTTSGFWIWAEDPQERAQHLGDMEQARRFRRRA